jgi:hypothetical protein
MLLWFKPKYRIVATIGYPGAGKTVFLVCLFWDSFFALSRTFRDKWHPFSVSALNEAASKLFYGNARMLDSQVLPPPNPRTQPEPAILHFKGIPPANGRRRRNFKLIFYDVAGEVFSDDRVTREYAPFVTHAHDLLFLFDPTHPDFSAWSAAELVNRVCRIAEDGEDKNLMITLTKMDELRSQDEWWANTIGDCWPDHSPSPAELSNYLHQMETLSQMLRGWWTDEARQAHNLINALPPNTCFCAVSSLGHPPVWDCPGCRTANSHRLLKCGQCHRSRGNAGLRLTKDPEPFRVRDPLFWIFRAAGVM